jgi:hypothetical protein
MEPEAVYKIIDSCDWRSSSEPNSIWSINSSSFITNQK